LFDRPIFQSGGFASRLGISKVTAHNFLRKLEKEGALQAIRKSSGSRSAIFAFKELIELAEGKQSFSFYQAFVFGILGFSERKIVCV
jgi:transposase